MSEMEFHTGKARKFSRNDGEDDIAYAKRYAEHKGLNFDEGKAKECSGGLHEIFSELELYGSWRQKSGLEAGGDIWELENHRHTNEIDEIDEAIKNEDGSVSFTYYFYNGGTCLEEMFSDSIEKMKP